MVCPEFFKYPLEDGSGTLLGAKQVLSLRVVNRIGSFHTPFHPVTETDPGGPRTHFIPQLSEGETRGSVRL